MYRRVSNPAAVVGRHPFTKRKHATGVWSIGANEEWCVDGHEKIQKSMGIGVWGIVDKFSRLEIGLWAVPNARVRELTTALYLRAAKKKGGEPLA